MSENVEQDLQPLTFAERIIQILNIGSRTATYKFALLIGLLDLCQERTSEAGLPPTSVTTREIAEKVVALYWMHARPYDEATGILRQTTRGQAEVISAIKAARFKVPDIHSLTMLRRTAREVFRSLLDKVERKFIEEPIPRLQTIGAHHNEFIYTINWQVKPDASLISRYQKDPGSTDFDNMLRFRPGAAASLTRLNGLLRPFIYRLWADQVALINQLNTEQHDLEGFLFGTDRVSLRSIAAGLDEVQQGRCFFCTRPLRSDRREVDHFIPWCRHADNGIENLVLAHRACNNSKRDFLASADHLRRWIGRMCDPATSRMLTDIADLYRWDQQPRRTVGVARSVYFGMGINALYWKEADTFVQIRPMELREILSNVPIETGRTN